MKGMPTLSGLADRLYITGNGSGRPPPGRACLSDPAMISQGKRR